MGIGDFVTAHVKGQDNDFIRQGVLAGFLSANTILVQCKSGSCFCCDDWTIVPESNLFGDTKEFVMQWRSRHPELQTPRKV